MSKNCFLFYQLELTQKWEYVICPTRLIKDISVINGNTVGIYSSRKNSHLCGGSLNFYLEKAPGRMGSRSAEGATATLDS